MRAYFRRSAATVMLLVAATSGQSGLGAAGCGRHATEQPIAAAVGGDLSSSASVEGPSVECGQPLSLAVQSTTTEGISLSVTEIRRVEATRPPEVVVKFSSVDVKRVILPGPTPLHGIVTRDGIVVDRFGLSETGVGPSGTGLVGVVWSISPEMPRIETIRGPSLCKADWATIWGEAAKYTVIAVISAPHAVEAPPRNADSDSLLSAASMLSR